MKNKIYTFLIFTLIILFQSTAFAANKYWVGGSGNWSDNQHWSDVSGGEGGASVPGYEDDVIINGNSFSIPGEITFDNGFIVNSLVSIPTVSVILYSPSNVVGLVDKEWRLNRLTTNNIQAAVHQINRENTLSYKYFEPNDFIGVTANYLNKDAEGKNQVLQVTSVTFNVTEETCPEACDGMITATPNDGVGPFVYQWFLRAGSSPNGNTPNATGVCGGAQTVVIRDLSDPAGTTPYINTAAGDVINVGPAPFASGIINEIDETCPGANDGQLVAFASGGTPPYNFSWSNGGGSNLIATNLPPNSYTLTITDFRNCVFTQPPLGTVDPAIPPVITDDVRDVPLCGGVGCIEDVTFNVDPGFVVPFNWTNGGSATDMCPGDVFNDVLNYTSPVDNISACVIPRTHTASSPPVVTATATETKPVTCLGVMDGEATASGSGGAGPYDFVWLNVPGNPTTANVTGLSQGNFLVEVTDRSSGCKDTATVLITSPTPQVVVANASITNIVTCTTAANGEATASGAGGTPGYSFNWYDAPGAPTTPVVTGLPVGTFNVEVKDLDGCVDTAQINVIPPLVSPVTASISTVDSITCLTAANGSATAAGAGGTSPYDFLWYDMTGTPITPTVNSLPLGVYNVEVTDQDNCKDTATVNIQVTLSNPVVASISSFSPVICLGLPTGDATAAGSGGTAPYDFLWYDLAGNPTTPMVNALDVGFYNVEVTDVDGCKDTATVNIQAPNPPILTTTLVPVLPSCGVQCDGGGSASTTGGQSPYSFDWFDSPLLTSGPVIANLCPGAYRVAVADVNGCKDTVTLDLNVSLLTAALDSKIDVSCTGVCSGEINVSASGGTSPYDFLWYDMPLTPTSTALTSVCAGTYNVEVTDALGCSDTLPVTITEPPIPLTINIDRQVNNTCVSNCLGEVDLSISGGVAPYNYQWIDSNGTVPSNPVVLSLANLCNGAYTFEVIDALTCTQTLTVNITSPVLTVAFTVSPLCPDDIVANVQAVASVSAPFDYKWLDPVTGASDNPLQIGLSPGTYDLEVTDNNNCTDTFPFTFAIPQPISGNALTTNALCKGICDGTINSTITGGTSPYTFLWYDMSASPTTKDLTGVCAGTYNLSIRDNNGCRDTLKAVTVSPTTILSYSTDSTEATCLGICDGKGWVTVNNGTVPYIYDWYTLGTGPSLNDTAFNLCSGSYPVQISDALGCLDTTTVIITSIPSVTVNIINQVNNVCSQDCNGSVEAVIAGGQTPYTLRWNNPASILSSNIVNNLCNGNYSFEVTDANLCKDTARVNIISAAATAVLTPNHPSCGGYNDGSATANLTGGAAPLNLSWYNVTGTPTSNIVNGLSQGTYNLEVLDAAGCRDTFSVALVDPYPILLRNTDHQSVSCFGVCDGKAWSTPIGGTAAYDYRWYDAAGTTLISITDSAPNLCFGQVNLTVEDANGCIDSGAVNITNPFSIDVATSVKAQCFGLCDGEITARVIGTSQPYSFLWDDPLKTNDSTALNLCAGTYKVIVTNGSGCKDSASASVVVNPEVFVSVSQNNALCTNTKNGSALITGSGGTAPFTYSWVDSLGIYSSNIPNPSDMGIGKYYGTATDDQGCSKRDSVIINDDFFIDAYAGNDLTRCVGETVLLVGSGGATYLWSTGETNDSIVVGPITTTTYTLTTTNGPCSDVDNVTITINDLPIVNAESDRSVMLEGMSATLTGIGAGTSGTYDWYPPLNMSDPTVQSPVVSPLVSTRYYLTVTDANGCRDTSSVLVEIIESILYPDGVSPNGDGVNDDWPIVYIENFPDATVEIYNRWGQQLFYSVGYNTRWDGTYKGEELPVGTYYFIIDLGANLPKYTGPITIFR